MSRSLKAVEDELTEVKELVSHIPGLNEEQTKYVKLNGHKSIAELNTEIKKIKQRQQEREEEQAIDPTKTYSSDTKSRKGRGKKSSGSKYKMPHFTKDEILRYMKNNNVKVDSRQAAFLLAKRRLIRDVNTSYLQEKDKQGAGWGFSKRSRTSYQREIADLKARNRDLNAELTHLISIIPGLRADLDKYEKMMDMKHGIVNGIVPKHYDDPYADDNSISDINSDKDSKKDIDENNNSSDINSAEIDTADENKADDDADLEAVIDEMDSDNNDDWKDDENRNE